MARKDILREIQALKTQRNAVILAHNYQIGEIQDIADFLGDSLELSRKAASTDADVIVFCGVHFMAETASILSPHKTVLLPDPEAGCPLADMATVSQLRKMKEKHSESEVVCYVNSSAAVKAESDICCTSANIVPVIKSLKGPHPPICVPDGNLARYAHRETGRDLIAWDGHCCVHTSIKAEDISTQKKQHPDAKVLVHPECCEDVIGLADEVLSTSGMCRYARETPHREMIIGTEVGILHKLRQECPDKIFYPVPNDPVCETMKKITLEKVYRSLRDMKYEIRVPEDIRVKAKMAVERMIRIS